MQGKGSFRPRLERIAETAEVAEQAGPVRRGVFGGGARGRLAAIGDKVGDGEVDLVSDARHHRERTGGDGAGENFLVESPEILDAAAAAGDDDEFRPLPATRFVEKAHPGGDFFGLPAGESTIA